ncbi:MAG: EAL domain-containing protein [Oscillospiraceae bacterium]
MEDCNKKKSMKKQIFLPVMLIIMFQAVVFLGILALSGEFGNIEHYAYDMLNEKTSNRANYVEREMVQKWSAIHESAYNINQTVEQILNENNEDISAISESKKINSEIMEKISDEVIYMMKKNNVNDAFVIFESGDLYKTTDGRTAKSCIYLRDVDADNSMNTNDILMEAGNSSIAAGHGIMLDSEWSVNLEMIYGDEENYSFFYDTISNAEKYPELSIKELGHWTKFSQISASDVQSIKYTLPLISGNGEVYGVVGIGVTEKNILMQMPSNDFFNDSSCYVLGVEVNSANNYRVQLHSGPVYSRLIGSENRIVTGYNMNENIIMLNQDSEYESVGCIYNLDIYSKNSPYYSDKWAVISMAERSQLLIIYYKFIKTLVISLMISSLIGMIAADMISRRICRPFSDVVDTLANTPPNEILQFATTNITEVDKLTEAIEDLQTAVEESASRVSEIINLVDIGIGVFMVDRMTESVFVSESLVKMLEINDLPDGDVNMEYYEFTLRINKKSKEKILFTGKPDEDFLQNNQKVLKINSADGSIKWLRFNTVNDNKKILGVVQDITSQMVEKHQIEYERDYDMTTGLLNRRAYYKRVAEKFQLKSNLKIAAFLMLDLDNLKYVNDTYGHDFGDDYIKSAANVLKEFDNYGGIVSRLSGDEFSVFLSGFNSKYEIRKIISEVREKLLSSYCILPDGSHFKIRASAGISWYPEHSESYEMLMKYSDFAMYTIKKSVKGSIAEFDMSVYSKDSILITGTEEMNRIIDEKSVRYAFHAIINAKNGEIYGYEALMRPQSDIIKSPLDFIRIAKTGAKLADVECLTWTQSLKDFRIQVEAGNIAKGSKIFINSISNCSLSREVINEIEETYSDMLSGVVLEILEGEEANSTYADAKKLRMKKWNAQIALDDFGTGYNSEYALITAEPDIIKIDRSIISGCDKDESRINIMQNLIKFANTKNIKVLAEGVETYDEMKTVINCGVDLIQGYYVSKPLYAPVPVEKRIADEVISINKNIAKR